LAGVLDKSGKIAGLLRPRAFLNKLRSSLKAKSETLWHCNAIMQSFALHIESSLGTNLIELYRNNIWNGAGHILTDEKDKLALDKPELMNGTTIFSI
jgi:hypothetical protein